MAVFICAGVASAKTAHSQVVKAKRTYYHADGYIKAIGKNARRTIYHPNPRISHRWKRDLHYLVRVRHRAYLTLHPPPPPKPALGHLDGWVCIHSREGAWDSQTGNGYYGGLQMTYGWAGRVSNAALLSPGQQIAAAEAEAAEHGWNYGWMQGQWPNTFPPCAAYF